MRTLYLFTASYPFNRSETFLEEEIQYLSSSFEHIEIVPLIGTGEQTREVPINCKVYKPIIKNRRQQYLNGLLCVKSLNIFIRDFFCSKVYKNRLRIKTWLIAYVISSNLIKSSTVKNIFKKIKKDDICYFYWGKGSNVLSYFYKGKAKFVSRFHGEWDLWEESSGGYGPIRSLIASSLDIAIFISLKGKDYFCRKYVVKEAYYCPLGTNDYGLSIEKTGDQLQIVSCSTVYPLKRVHLIYDSICRLPYKSIIWTHIGGGKDLNKLIEYVEFQRAPNIRVNFLGALKHDEVMKLYTKEYYDIFVNLSINEGVPVSIMEAASFNIPIVATDVGGTPEIVTSKTGATVSANPTAEEVAMAIVDVYKNRLKFAPRAYWKEKFFAETNYNKLVEILKKKL